MSESNSSQLPRLAIIIPCYNEQEVLPDTLDKLLTLLNSLCEKRKIALDSFLYCVDDGSHDLTWSIIADWHSRFSQIKGLKLSRNTGHQNALYAGLMSVKNKLDCVVTIDADLQDDPTAIETMVEHFQNGSDLVYGIRRSRDKDSLFKKFTAVLFYKFIKKLGADIVVNHADFRLLSNRTLLGLSQFKERNLFLRGIFPLIGYRSSHVYYDRAPRQFGKSKYSLRKMIALAWEGTTSFSHAPLDFILVLGIASFILSLGVMAWAIIAQFLHLTVPGWTSVMIPLCFMGGIQLLSVGILGEYIAKVYMEVKRRPRFIKDRELF